jgi:N-succinyldiaminopimelate aminotransferase
VTRRLAYGLAMGDRVPFLASRLQGLGTTIFAEMSALAARTGAINLGQGFPDTDGPAEVAEAAVAAIRAGANQYPPGTGIPSLREAISEHQRRFWGLEYDPVGEVLVTAGATEAITAALVALCEIGDEIIVFEPSYDSYPAAAAIAGATLRPVTLHPPDYAFDPEELARAVTPRTRLLLLNSPHNPTGKVFGPDELAAIARVCIDHDLIAVTDEVYEHIVFDGTHVPLATLPGMRERTVTVSSGGKTFSFTGWKVGWACGPAALVDAVRTVKQFLTYVNAAPLQPAIAAGLRLEDDYFTGLAAGLSGKRDLLCAGLAAAGFDVFRPAGTYFVTADIRPLAADGDGPAFCRRLPDRCGVVAIPNSVFYQDPARGRHLVRFVFCKRDEVLEEAVIRLKGLRNRA